MNFEEFRVVEYEVKKMLKTSEKISEAENYATSLYANGHITSEQFNLLCKIIYG